MKLMTLKKAKETIGSLGEPSKMPGFSYGLPAADATWVPALAIKKCLPVPTQFGCMVGAKLAKIPGTPCFKCYANGRGNYQYDSLKYGQLKRLVGLTFNKLWSDAMVRLIDHYIDPKDPYFRWHDSGDLLGAWHLRLIIKIAKKLPHVKFWLPTQERKILNEVFKDGTKCPSNLIIRISHTRLDRFGTPQSNSGPYVYSGVTKSKDYTCHAPDNDNNCGDCRKCWDPSVPLVVYPAH